MWHHRAAGAGRPIVLLHGIGMSHAVWDPVVPFLTSTRTVVAFDVAGFGDTPPLPAGTPPTIANLAGALRESIAALGLPLPIDVAGNSLGGSIALEAGVQGFARAIAAISPAGLWHTHDAPHVRCVFGALRFGATRMRPLIDAMMGSAWLRELTLAVPLSAGSGRMPVAAARGAVGDLARAAAFERTFANTRAPYVARGIRAPVTVAFGGRDWILPARSRDRGALPAHTRWLEPPSWGHVPMWVDPAGVAGVILRGTR